MSELVKDNTYLDIATCVVVKKQDIPDRNHNYGKPTASVVDQSYIDALELDYYKIPDEEHKLLLLTRTVSITVLSPDRSILYRWRIQSEFSNHARILEQKGRLTKVVRKFMKKHPGWLCGQYHIHPHYAEDK